MELKNGRTSADYARIEQLGLAIIDAARAQRPSAMLDYAMLDKLWRDLELGCMRHSYDIFKAWRDLGERPHQLRMQLQWLTAKHLDTPGDALTEVAMRDAAELREKNAAYGESWKRRGGQGAFMMLARKWDRLDNLLAPIGGGQGLDNALRRNPGDVLDDIGDLRRYLLLCEDEVLRLEDLPHYGHDEPLPALLMFGYLNHRREHYVYTVRPLHVAFGPCGCDPDDPAREAWFLRAQVIKRGEEVRDVERSFALYKMQGTQELPDAG